MKDSKIMSRTIGRRSILKGGLAAAAAAAVPTILIRKASAQQENSHGRSGSMRWQQATAGPIESERMLLRFDMPFSLKDFAHM